jgi:phospholipid/cholesterol/gamma-HCH transport system ATP-binding protein
VHSIFRIADRVLMLNQARIVADGSPAELRESTDPAVQQFIQGRAEGPILIV